MSAFIQLSADVLVATLLVAMIGVSVRLSRNLSRLKADESAMKLTIAELMVATETAERAIAGMRGALHDCERSLAERLKVAERCIADLSAGTAAGEAVLGRVDAIVEKTRRLAQAREPLRAEPLRADAPRAEPVRIELPRLDVPTPAPVRSPLDIAVATAQAVAERAARRLAARAA